MEKNLSLSQNQSLAMGLASVLMQFAALANRPVEMLAKYYSDCLDRPINRRQTWLLLNAQAAFAMAAFPVAAPLCLRMVCIAWLLHALKLCKENL